MNAAKKVPTNDEALETIALAVRDAIETQRRAINEREAAYRRGDILAACRSSSELARAEIAENEAYRDYFTVGETARRAR